MIIAATRERRRAETFAAAVGRRPGVDSGHDLDHDVVALVRLAETLRETGGETPRPEFVRLLREQLMREASSGIDTPAVVHDLEPRRRLGAVAAAFVAATVSIGLVTESVQALPGEALYPIKRSIENVRVAMAQDPEAEGFSRLEVAGTRLDEVAALASGDEGIRETAIATTTLDAFTAQVEQAADSLFPAPADDGDSAAVEKVTAFTHSARAALEAVVDDLPEAASASVAAAMATLRDLSARAEKVCHGCQAPSFMSPAGASISPVRERTGATGAPSGPESPAEDRGASAPQKARAAKDERPGATGEDPPASGTRAGSSPSDRESLRLTSGSGTLDKATELVAEVADRTLVKELLERGKDPGPDSRE